MKNMLHILEEIPDIICVADLGVWKSQKMIVPNYDNGKGAQG